MTVLATAQEEPRPRAGRRAWGDPASRIPPPSGALCPAVEGRGASAPTSYGQVVVTRGSVGTPPYAWKP
jgi:hypothetical protein